MDQTGAKWTVRIGQKWIELDEIGVNEPYRTDLSVYNLYLLKLIKMTCGSPSRIGNGLFKVALKTTLTYE